MYLRATATLTFRWTHGHTRPTVSQRTVHANVSELCVASFSWRVCGCLPVWGVLCCGGGGAGVRWTRWAPTTTTTTTCGAGESRASMYACWFSAYIAKTNLLLGPARRLAVEGARPSGDPQSGVVHPKAKGLRRWRRVCVPTLERC